MRIAFYLSHYPAAGGSTAAIRGLTQGLTTVGWDVEVLAQGDETTERAEGSVLVRTFRRSSRVPFLVPPALRTAVCVDRPDLLVLAGAFHTDLPLLARTARGAGVKYIHLPLTWYSPAMFAKHGIRKQVYWHLVERRLLAGASAIHAHSEAEERYLRQRGVSSPVVVTPHGCDTTSVDIAPVCRRDQSVVIGYLGRLDLWVKGLDLLVKAFAVVRKSHPDVTLVLQGSDSGDRAALQHLVQEYQIGEAVEIREPVYGRSKALMANWDIYVAASRHDCFPVSVMEAMMAGRVVLCSEETGTAEHVRRARCGLVVEPTIEGLVHGLDELISMEDRWQDLGAAGQSYASQQFSWDAVGTLVAAAYQAVSRGNLAAR